MAAIPIGLIRVLTTSDRALLESHGKMIEQAYPTLDITSVCLPGQPQGVFDAESEAEAAAKVPFAARTLRSLGARAIIISCAGDPGLEGAQAEVDVPVIGAGVAAAAVALTFGLPVGVLSLTAEVPPRMARILGSHLLHSLCPASVRTTLDFLTPEGRAVTLQVGRTLRERGAGVICLACTGMSTAGFAPVLRRELGVPVVDPVLAAGGTALLRLALEGLR
ncbi:MAG: aspartate/glutamate racemase family protein [Chloroflexota bacterium]|nr:aspartate/glutamate racemase family protein [Chloroflexota bacterium]